VTTTSRRCPARRSARAAAGESACRTELASRPGLLYNRRSTGVDKVIGTIYLAENLDVLRDLPDGSVDLIYVDPPFNTGKIQYRTRIQTSQSTTGDRTGFAGRRYETTVVGTKAFQDAFADYLGFLQPRLSEAHRVLAGHGSFYLHLDYREVHYCKVLLDQIFGRECFLNEIIWAYDYGARTKKRWPPKHDNILLYAKDASHYVFNSEAIERIPYMAPGLVGPDKAARGKLPTDTWWHTIVPTNGAERTGYPTQKPVGILKRIVVASSRPGDLVLDFFAGSGTTGEACLALGRRFLLVDDNPQALEVMARRFNGIEGIRWVGFCPSEQPSEPMLLEASGG
jgi:site-specific DNA-methyltransferase (adenine-specific)